MRFFELAGSLIPAVLLALAGGVGSAAEEKPEPASEPAAGELLIASAQIQDPRFYHSVILLLRHNDKGAFGIIVNHPVGEQPLATLLGEVAGKPSAKDDDKNIEGTIGVFVGGPVERTAGFVIHSTDYQRPETLVVGDVAAMTSSIDILRDIGHHHGPQQFLFALGYAGWGGGQLEGEIARHDWFTAPAEAGLIFDGERDSTWQRALARRTHEL